MPTYCAADIVPFITKEEAVMLFEIGSMIS
jgi:hypothetical protein